jgi:hypothetical protein
VLFWMLSGKNLYYGEFFETAEPLAGLALKKGS